MEPKAKYSSAEDENAAKAAAANLNKAQEKLESESVSYALAFQGLQDAKHVIQELEDVLAQYRAGLATKVEMMDTYVDLKRKMTQVLNNSQSQLM
jgi:hypothetical protein